MDRTVLIGVCLMCLSGTAAIAERPVGIPDAGTVLNTLGEDHPRLILTGERLAELKSLMRRDPLLKRCAADIIRKADEYRSANPLVHYKRDGVRLLSVSRDCLARTYALSLAWRLTGKDKYAEKAKENLLAVCAFRDWNPSHFLDTAEMSHAVGIGYDWLFDYLDAESRDRIRAGLIANGLKPGLAKYQGQGAWPVKSMINWNQVCNGGLIVGSLAIAETDPRYAGRIIPRAVEFLPNALATYAPDGAWPEGPGYWRYATRYTAYGLAAMDTALGTDFGLSGMEGLSLAGLFPIYTSGPTDLYFNFADVGENARRRNIPCLFWLARKFDNPFFAQAEREMLSREPADPHDFIWYVPKGQSGAPEPTLDKYFRGPVEVAVFRSAWNDPGALFVGVKAGYNQANHGHLDLGTFVLDAMGVRWARDLGKENYNLPGYWNKGKDARRWTYYRLSTLSHNVPVIDGKNQNHLAETEFTRFRTSPSDGFAILDLTSAYKDFAQKVTRGVATVGNRKAVLIQDEFQTDRPRQIAWTMTTGAKIVVERDRAVLTSHGKKLTARILSPAGAQFVVESAEQEPPLYRNKGIKRLMVRLKKQAGSVRIAVLLAPAWPEEGPAAAPKIKALAQW